MLEINNVSKYYGDYTALDNVSFSVPEGTVFGLLGPNGAGKTSLIRILNQIVLPDKGTVFFNGELLNETHISQIGYLPEERGLYKSMKVGEQALYLAQLKGMSKKAAKEKLLMWFEKFGISDWWNKKIQELSKGMAQKVQFIVTVLHEPKLLIFDEPFSGFDPVNAELIANEIIELKNKGATIIFSTHRMESVEKMCDHVVLIHKSKKVLQGSLKELQQEYSLRKFEVAVDYDDTISIERALENEYKIEKGDFQTLRGNSKFLIQLRENQTREDLLEKINSFGVITHFLEQIPTMNSIFMKAVSKTSIE